MASNKSLGDAKNAKKDEFYTQLCDIEAELKHYTRFFKGKTVLCNCDDPYESNFFYYFASRFNDLGLKKLIATCYDGSPVAYTQLDLFGEDVNAETQGRRGGRARSPSAPNDPKPRHERCAYKIVITEVGDENGDGTVDIADVEYLIKNRKNVLTRLNGNGDFRSPECVELLKEADVVVTNPPFSLFREYVAQLVQYKKKFLIIGNQNAITYKDCFSLLMKNEMWLGASIHSGDREFAVPDDYPLEAAGSRVDDTGRKYIRVKGVRWFTNLDYKERHEDLVLVRHYTPEEYPKYANYDAIEVPKTADIPCDYYGEMGVPITFLDKYNPDQFEIIGSSRWLGRPMSEIAPKGSYVSGGIRFYLQISATPPCLGAFMTESSSDVKYQRLYDRIVIKRKR